LNIEEKDIVEDEDGGYLYADSEEADSAIQAYIACMFTSLNK
jgi:hypothetical protein